MPLVSTRSTQVIYLDNHATTPVDPRVADVVLRYMTQEFGNASSVDHVFGNSAAEAVEQAREHVRTLVGAHGTDRIIFTSGATESINLGLKGMILEHRSRGGDRRIRIGLLPIEHPAVLDTVNYLETCGTVETRFFNIDAEGRLDLNSVEEECKRGLDIVCIMTAQNEIGNVYPVQKIAHIANENSALFFTDATQAAGKIQIRFDDWNIGCLVLSAHKMYGPKGVGALVIPRDLRLHTLMHGGSHQSGIRAGTLNVPGIVGLGEASRLRSEEWESDERRIRSLRDRFWASLMTQNTVRNGDSEHCLAGNLNVSFIGTPNQALLGRLRRVLAASTGSACSSGLESPSAVLRKLQVSAERLNSSIRFGIGKFNTVLEIDEASNLILEAIEDIKGALAGSTVMS